MMMFSTRRIAIAALVLLAVATSSSAVNAQQQHVEEIHHSSVPQEGQRRKLTWDFFGFLMMMVSGECGPANHIRLGDHPKCHACYNGNEAKCSELCSMSSDPHKSHYDDLFCESGGTSTQYNEASDSSSFSGSTTPGGFNTGGSMAKGFQWWMVAAAAAVIMAMAAVIMGQRRDRSRQRSAMAGAVGRRFTAVNAFAEGIFPTKKPSAVEMAPAAAAAGGVAAASGDYQLDNDGDDQTAPVDDENVSTASPGSEGSEGKDYAMC